MIRNNDSAARIVFSGAAIVSAAITIAVLGFMVVLSLPVLKKGFVAQIFSAPWSPHHGQFGILPMIAGTVCIAGLSLLISLPLSLGCSFFISIVRPGRIGNKLKKTVQAMTAIPTVVYGFVGVFFLVPLVRERFVYGSGMCILSASLMLGIVISPTLILFFSQSFAGVPKTVLNAADALGATPWQKLAYVILPGSFRGMLTGVILAFGRAMGDTLIALMISGNSVALPSGILDSARTLTAHIALIIASDFDSIEFKILFVCGTLLYMITGLGIILARYMSRQAP